MHCSKAADDKSSSVLHWVWHSEGKRFLVGGAWIEDLAKERLQGRAGKFTINAMLQPLAHFLDVFAYLSEFENTIWVDNCFSRTMQLLCHVNVIISYVNNAVP